MAEHSPATIPEPGAASGPGRGELIADGIVHALGLAAGAAGAGVLLTLAAMRADAPEFLALLVYACGLLAMLACSAAYNLARTSPRRELLRRFDHAAIFAMIAGTYTPFTVLRLEGGWAAGLTAAVWTIAALGIALKLFRPRLIERASIPLYLALGWIIVVAIEPLLGALDPTTLILLAAGGLLYTAGVVFHVWERLPFQNAAWHGFVLAAAATHYVAILTGVLLAADARA